MKKEIECGLVFSWKEIENVWGAPKLSVRVPCPYIPLKKISQNDLDSVLGLRIYARITGYTCSRVRESIVVELVSGSRFFNGKVKPKKDRFLLEISGNPSQGKKRSGNPGIVPSETEKPVYLHGTVCIIEDGKIVDDIRPVKYA